MSDDTRYTMTVVAGTVAGLKANLEEAAAAITIPQQAPNNSNLHLDEEAPAQAPAAVPRRGRPPKAASPASQANGAGAEKSPTDMRQEAIEILSKIWGGPQGPGSKSVLDLQAKFGVKRFAEVPDDKVASLLQAAVALQVNLAGGGSTSTDDDTGPF
jgi:hypothetical protein